MGQSPKRTTFWKMIYLLTDRANGTRTVVVPVITKNWTKIPLSTHFLQMAPLMPIMYCQKCSGDFVREVKQPTIMSKTNPNTYN